MDKIKILTSLAILTGVIVGGIIFWNKLSLSKQGLVESYQDAPTSNSSASLPSSSTSSSQASSQSKAQSKNTDTSSIEGDLNAININDIDSDSAEMNSQASGL